MKDMRDNSKIKLPRQDFALNWIWGMTREKS